MESPTSTLVFTLGDLELPKARSHIINACTSDSAEKSYVGVYIIFEQQTTICEESNSRVNLERSGNMKPR